MAASSLDVLLPELVTLATAEGQDIHGDFMDNLLKKMGAVGLVRVRDSRRGLPENEQARRREVTGLVKDLCRDVPDIVLDGYVEVFVAAATAARARFSRETCQSVLGSNAVPTSSRPLDGNLIQLFLEDCQITFSSVAVPSSYPGAYPHEPSPKIQKLLAVVSSSISPSSSASSRSTSAFVPLSVSLSAAKVKANDQVWGLLFCLGDTSGLSRELTASGSWGNISKDCKQVVTSIKARACGGDEVL